MRVKMPDGTIIENVPDGTTQEELLGRYTAYKGGAAEAPATPAEQPYDPEPSAKRFAQKPFGERVADVVVGAPETMVGMVAGIPRMAEEVARTGGHLLADQFTGVPLTRGSIDEARQRASEGAVMPHYQPRSETAKLATQGLGELMQYGLHGAGQAAALGSPLTIDKGGVRLRNPQEVETLSRVGELGAEAAMAVAPLAGLRGRRPPKPSETPAPTRLAPEAPVEPGSTPPPVPHDPIAMMERAFDRPDSPVVRRSVTEPDGTAYELPSRIEPRPTADSSITDAIHRFRERGAVEVEPVQTELPLGPGKKQMGAVGDLTRPAPGTAGYEAALDQFIQTLPKTDRGVSYRGKVYRATGAETHADAVKRILEEHGTETFKSNDLQFGIITPDGKFLTHAEHESGKHGLFRDNTDSISRSAAERAFTGPGRSQMGAIGDDLVHPALVRYREATGEHNRAKSQLQPLKDELERLESRTSRFGGPRNLKEAERASVLVEELDVLEKTVAAPARNKMLEARKAFEAAGSPRPPGSLGTGPGKRQAGATGHLNKLSRLEEAATRLEQEIRDATNREERDTVRQFKEELKEVREDIDAIKELHTSETTGPVGQGRRQMGGILSRGKAEEVPVQRTPFEESQDLPAGTGHAVPDLDAVARPLDNVAMETMAVGRDLNKAMGREDYVKLKNDIGLFTKNIFTPEHISKILAQKNPLVKSVIDRVVDIKRHWQSVLHDFRLGGEITSGSGLSALRHMKPIKGGGFEGMVEKLNRTEQLDFFKTKLRWDNAEQLVEEGRQWPTREEVMAEGASAKIADAYMIETKYMDAMYEFINRARSLTGLKPIERIPGYMPHTYKGHMAIRILERIVGEDGVVTHRPVGFTKAEGNRKAIRQMGDDVIREINEARAKTGNPPGDFTREVYRTDVSGSPHDIVNALETSSQVFAHSDKGLIKLVKKVLDNRVASMEQRFLSAALHRDGIKGWIGSAGASDKNLSALIKGRAQAMESVIKYAESSELQASIAEKLSPEVWKELERSMPETTDFITRYIDVARDAVDLNRLDKSVLSTFAEATGDRFSYRTPFMGIGKLRKFFSMKDLGWSLSYHTGNFVQPEMIGTSALMRERARIGRGDAAQAILKMETESVAPSPENIAAIKWAGQEKIINPTLMQSLDTTMIGPKAGRSTLERVTDVGEQVYGGRRLSELNEEFGRLKTFIMGLEYYRSTGMKEPQARKAAGKFVDDVMVDYNTTGVPLWLSSNPMGVGMGKMLAPYAAFRHSFWGHMALAVQAIKNNPSLGRKILPALQLQVASVTFAGLRGIPMMAEATAAVVAFNALWQSVYNEEGPLPNPMDLAMSSTQGNPGGDAALFGVLSASTRAIPGLQHGADIGSSTGAPEISGLKDLVGARGIEGAMDVGKSIPTLLKLTFGGNATNADKLRLWKSIIPTTHHGWFEAAYKENDSDVIGDENKGMKGKVIRDSADWRARLMTGKRSITEERERMVVRSAEAQRGKSQDLTKALVEAATDSYEKNHYIKDEILLKADELGLDLGDFQKRVESAAKARTTTQIQRRTETKSRSAIRQQYVDRVDSMLGDVY